jgi:hypothetical protein
MFSSRYKCWLPFFYGWITSGYGFSCATLLSRQQHQLIRRLNLDLGSGVAIFIHS